MQTSTQGFEKNLVFVSMYRNGTSSIGSLGVFSWERHLNWDGQLLAAMGELWTCNIYIIQSILLIHRGWEPRLINLMTIWCLVELCTISAQCCFTWSIYQIYKEIGILLLGAWVLSITCQDRKYIHFLFSFILPSYWDGLFNRITFSFYQINITSLHSVHKRNGF